MNSFKITFACMALVLFFNTNAQTLESKKEILISDQLKWSERMALSIMKRHPEAWQIDNHPAPKWDYKIGLLMTSFEKFFKFFRV